MGCIVKGVGPAGRPLVAATHVHTVADQLRAAVSAGFVVRGLAEEPSSPEPDEELPQPNREVGDWRWWPWSLLEWDP